VVDLLSMTATVIDKASGPLSAIQKALTQLSKQGAKDVRELGGNLDLLSKNLTGVVTPALQAFGITSLSLTGIIGGLGYQLRNFAQDAVHLRAVSQETRFSVGELNRFQAVMTALKMPGQAEDVLRPFSQTMLEISQHTQKAIGLQQEFMRAGRLDVYQDIEDSLKNAKNYDQALENTLDIIAKLYNQSPILATRMANMLGLSAEFASKQKEVRALLGQIFEPDELKAKAFNDNMIRMQGTFNRLYVSIENALLPAFTEWSGAFNKWLEENRGDITSGVIKFFCDLHDAILKAKTIWDDFHTDMSTKDIIKKDILVPPPPDAPEPWIDLGGEIFGGKFAHPKGGWLERELDPYRDMTDPEGIRRIQPPQHVPGSGGFFDPTREIKDFSWKDWFSKLIDPNSLIGGALQGGGGFVSPAHADELPGGPGSEWRDPSFHGRHSRSTWAGGGAFRYGGVAEQELNDPKTDQDQKSIWRKAWDYFFGSPAMDVLDERSATAAASIRSGKGFSDASLDRLRTGAATAGVTTTPGGSAYTAPTGTTPTGSKADIASLIASDWGASGMSKQGIAGLLRNVSEESGFNPSSREADQPHFGGEAHFAHGLYQEGGSEWNNYSAWLTKNHPGADWRDPHLQNEFTIWNLQNRYPGVWNRMQNARTSSEAHDAFMQGYLRPAAGAAASRLGASGDAYYPMIDRALKAQTGAQKVEGTGSLTVDVRAPRGAFIKAAGGGLFKKVKMNRSMSMATAPDDSEADPSSSGGGGGW
jgi:hypothetical protein